MWLINVESLKLEQKVSPAGLPYAILSHTWGDDEITFEQFRALNGDLALNAYSLLQDQKRGGGGGLGLGLSKILRTCHLARQQHLPYAWVDTCCIDKSSSAELSEAINSMFSWYRESALCIAFLHDLPPNAYLPEALPRCRWFTRGWTLQELIAPRLVEFYDQAWVLRGSKHEYPAALSKITGVDRAVLKSSENLSGVLVAKRMSWVATRQTTRVEDIAYCMLGIFDINMPLLYGEGHKAFLRLQEEIARQSCDLSLLAWLAPPPDVGGYQEYRGVFALAPSEFSHFKRLHAYKQPASQHEFVITNKGIRLESVLHFAHDELVLNLDISWRDVEDKPASSAQIYSPFMGIYLCKTCQGYARVFPDRLCMTYDAVREDRFIPRSVLYLCKTLDAKEARQIHLQYAGALQIILESNDISILQLEPAEFWDCCRDTFLNPKSAITGYVKLRLEKATSNPSLHHGVHAVSPTFHAILAFSTGESSWGCYLCGEQDGNFEMICSLIERSREIDNHNDGTFVRLMKDSSWTPSRLSICRFEDRNTGFQGLLWAEMRDTDDSFSPRREDFPSRSVGSRWTIDTEEQAGQFFDKRQDEFGRRGPDAEPPSWPAVQLNISWTVKWKKADRTTPARTKS